MIDDGLVKQTARKIAASRLVRWGYDKTLDDPEDWVRREAEAETVLEDALAVLEYLAEAGLLLPPDGHTRLEYGLDQTHTSAGGILMIGVGERAKRVATHTREVTVWPDSGPNDYWARYVTLWQPIDRSPEDGTTP